MTLRYKMFLFAVKVFEDFGINVDRAQLLSLSIVIFGFATAYETTKR